MPDSKPAITRITAPIGCAGRGVGALFFSLFLLAGLGVLFFVVGQFRRILDSYSWDSVPCRIVSSRYERQSGDPGGYHFRVEYSYQVGGRDRRSSTFASHDPLSNDFSKIQRLLHRYPPGAQSQCSVDPQHSGQAVLVHSSLWFGLVLLFPMVFIGVGAGGIYFSLRRRGPSELEQMEQLEKRLAEIATAPREVPAGSNKDETADVENAADDSAAAIALPAPPPKRSKVVGIAVLGAALLLGGLGMVVLFGWQSYRALQAGNWPALPCQVVSSELRRHESTDSDNRTQITYSPDILYRYEIAGAQYLANRYCIAYSSGSHDLAQDIVREYPAGKAATCYVDPADPYEAVLDPTLSPGLLFGLLSLIPLLVSWFLLSWVGKQWRLLPATNPAGPKRQDTLWGDSNPKRKRERF